MFCCWTNVCTAVKKLATVTPARTSVAESRSCPAARPIAYASDDRDRAADERGDRQQLLAGAATRGR